jgi:hypothetical protein
MHLATLNMEKKFGARMNPGVKIERRVHPAEKGVRLEPWASSSAHIQWLLMLAHNDVVHLSCPASCALPPRARSPSCGFTDGHLPPWPPSRATAALGCRNQRPPVLGAAQLLSPPHRWDPRLQSEGGGGPSHRQFVGGCCWLSRR